MPEDPAAADRFLARFDWHPEPELVGYRDAGASREAMRALGHQTWDAALDYLYGIAVERAMGDPAPYDEIRARFYAASGGGPAPLPDGPSRADDLLAEWRDRLAGGQMNSQHPRQFGYFTPPPLPMSIMGELLAQVVNQGVDVWHAGPTGAFVEEEVVRWLCELVGYDARGFGVLTSGGVMANVMAMTLARDLRLGRLLGLDGPPRGRQLEGARVYTSDQSHFSVPRGEPDLHRAHTVTVDPHKWFFQAYDIGGLLVRDRSMLAAVFGGRAPEYYRGGERAVAAADDDHGDQLNFYKLSFEGTRRWRALKLWLSWKHLGTAGFGRLVEANDDVAAHLARRIAEADDFEALPERPELSVVCFRHRPPGVDGPALDAHQDALQRALEVDGDGWLTTTRLRGSTWLRAGIVNYLATEDDIDRLLATLRRLAYSPGV